MIPFKYARSFGGSTQGYPMQRSNTECLSVCCFLLCSVIHNDTSHPSACSCRWWPWHNAFTTQFLLVDSWQWCCLLLLHLLLKNTLTLFDCCVCWSFILWYFMRWQHCPFAVYGLLTTGPTIEGIHTHHDMDRHIRVFTRVTLSGKSTSPAYRA
jgi:hypothetical protein